MIYYLIHHVYSHLFFMSIKFIQMEATIINELFRIIINPNLIQYINIPCIVCELTPITQNIIDNMVTQNNLELINNLKYFNQYMYNFHSLHYYDYDIFMVLLIKMINKTYIQKKLILL